jgi:hypothetical protein
MSAQAATTKAIQFVLFMGAANEVATPEQTRAMRDQIEPLLAHYVETGDESLVRNLVYETLGADFEPTGMWANYIEALD